jgi:hypothetical protein
MAFKPNYNQQRAERNRAKLLKKQEKSQRRDEEAAARNPAAPDELPDTGSQTAEPQSVEAQNTEGTAETT